MKKVSFDFDGTLLLHEFILSPEGEVEEVVPKGPNPIGISLLQGEILQGSQVFIVSSRSKNALPLIEGMLKGEGLLSHVSGIYLTGGMPKRETLSLLGIHSHYDDDPEEFHPSLSIQWVLVPQ